jgi:hypothetical protein
LEKDCRLLGAFGITWNLFLAISPASVIKACNTAMDAAGMPRMETESDQKGKIFPSLPAIYIIDQFQTKDTLLH